VVAVARDGGGELAVEGAGGIGGGPWRGGEKPIGRCEI
jgi:hypothetical protein